THSTSHGFDGFGFGNLGGLGLLNPRWSFHPGSLTLAGAVYNPLPLIEPAPAAGVTAQFTAVFEAFATVAVNCCVPPPYTVAVAGPTVTDTGGESVTVAVPVLIPSAWLLAVIVTF